jgi:ATP-dependent Lhr-like helicase
MEPGVAVPAEFSAKSWDRSEALREIVRGRLEGLGPTTAAAMANALGVAVSEIDAALIALETEGFAMRGSFEPELAQVQWCERRLLARINRYTVKRLRKEIEPVSAADFMRFLLDWQHATADARMEGPDAVAAVISQLEGFEAAAAAWEAEILPARVSGYEPSWLDDLCLAGRVVWTRLEAPKIAADRAHGPSPVRSTPVTSRAAPSSSCRRVHSRLLNISNSTAPHSSMTSLPAWTCRALSWKRRSESWSRSASRIPMDSAVCARCCSHRIGASHFRAPAVAVPRC